MHSYRSGLWTGSAGHQLSELLHEPALSPVCSLKYLDTLRHPRSILPSKEAPDLGTDEQVGAEDQFPGDKLVFIGHVGVHTGLPVGWGLDR